MSAQQHTPPLTPQPLAERYEALLPLLSLHELTADDEADIRAHVAGCAWCQAQLDSYAGLRLALRRQYGAEQTAQPLPALEAIMSSGSRTAPTAREDTRRRKPFLLPQISRRSRPTELAALVATLLIAVLAVALFRSRVTTPVYFTVPGLGEVTQYTLPIARSQPREIIVGRDGTLWFTENGKIGRITTSGAITNYPLPEQVILNDLALGSDGDIWFADGVGKIGRLNPRDGSVTEFGLPTKGVQPGRIISGRDGALWFTAPRSAPSLNELVLSTEIGRITTNGVITMYPVPSFFWSNRGLTVGPDGAIWFCGGTGGGPDIIGRLSSTGAVTQYPIPGQSSGPSTIVAGSDGALWFNGQFAQNPGQIGRLTTNGVFSIFPTPVFATEMAPGPDGEMWFASDDEQQLGRITSNGVVTMHQLPAGVNAYSLTTGPDGALWFTDASHNAIDQLRLSK